MSQRKRSGDVLYKVKHKEGVHLASSHDSDGALRGILFDDETNRLVGHAELEPVDESEYGCDYSYDNQENQQEGELSPEEQKLAQFLGKVIATGTVIVLTQYVAPYVSRWWQNKAVPTMREKWKIFTDKRKVRPSPKGKNNFKSLTNEIVTTNEIVREMVSHELEEAYENYMKDMASEEAQRELLDIFILSALLTIKIRKLSNARIIINGVAPGEFLEGQKIIGRLTTPEYISSINLILENNPQLMEEKTAALSGILGRNLVLNGQYEPIEIGKFKEAMILQVDGCDDL